MLFFINIVSKLFSSWSELFSIVFKYQITVKCKKRVPRILMNYTSLKGNAFHLDFVFLSFEFSYTQFHDKKFRFTISSNYKLKMKIGWVTSYCMSLKYLSNFADNFQVKLHQFFLSFPFILYIWPPHQRKWAFFTNVQQTQH